MADDSDSADVEFAQRLDDVRRRIAACSPRGPVEIVAVTKGHGLDAWHRASGAGCEGIGENYAQELLAKWEANDRPVAPIHFVGSIQTNKVRALAGIVDVWHGLDRESAVDAVARRTVQDPDVGSRRNPRVFVQVNATGEPTKSGCAPGDAASLVASCRSRGLDVAGLMAMGPADADPGRSERAFRLVRALADDLGLGGCSMGMSDDFELAVACGATTVRLGTVLFGPRRPRP